MAKSADVPKGKTIAENRRARFDYAIEARLRASLTISQRVRENSY